MKKVKVTLSNNQILHLERGMADYWIKDKKQFVSFRDVKTKNPIKIGMHWIISIEEE